jgi:hypothetical protein
MDRRDVQALADGLMESHGLKGWRFQWIGSCQTLGRCSRYRKTIYLSLPFVQIGDEAQVRDTILHEIAHALTPGGHTPAWKATSARIGASPKRCANYVPIPRHRQIRGRKLPDARQLFLDF